MISSSSEMKNWASPGSPWRAHRPESWRSIRPRLVPFGADDVQPAQLGDALAELDVGAAARHVGRDGNPADCPAWATIWASISWFLAFKIWCSMPCALSKALNSSDFSIDRVPTSTGTPRWFHSTIWSATAWNLRRCRKHPVRQPDPRPGGWWAP